MSTLLVQNALLLVTMGGAHRRLLAAIVFCAPQTADSSVINGQILVRNDHLTRVALRSVIGRHNRISRQFAGVGWVE